MLPDDKKRADEKKAIENQVLNQLAILRSINEALAKGNDRGS